MNKEKLDMFINLFTRITTGIFLFSGIYILIFFGTEPGLSIIYVFAIIGMSALFALVRTLIYKEDTISKKAKLIQEICFFLFVNAVVLAAGFVLRWFNVKNLKTVVGMEITIFAVYFSVMIITYTMEVRIADKMNKKLQERKNKIS